MRSASMKKSCSCVATNKQRFSHVADSAVPMGRINRQSRIKQAIWVELPNPGVVTPTSRVATV